MPVNVDRTRAWVFLGIAGAVLVPAVVLVNVATPAPQQVLFLSDPPQTSPESIVTPTTDTTMHWIDEVQRSLQYDSRFGSLAISDDRSTVTIPWFGDQSRELMVLIDAAPSDLEVVVLSTDFAHGDLQKLVSAAMEPQLMPGVVVAMGYVQNDGNGIHLGIVEEPRGGRTLSDVARAFGAALDRPDVPITVEVSGEIVPLAGVSN